MRNALTSAVKQFVQPLPAIEEKRDTGLLVPNLTTNPPTWADFNDLYNGQVSVEQALAIPAVQASIRIIATAVSQLDMNVERTINGVKSPLDSPLVARPDADRSQSAFMKRTTINLATTGNAFWRLYRNSDGAVVNMVALEPSRVAIRYSNTGVKTYVYTDYSGNDVTLSNNTPTSNGQVEHIRLFELEGHTLGLGPIQLNNDALYNIAELRWYTNRVLRESRRPSGIYSIDSYLDDDELAQAKSRIQSNRTTGEPDVLDRGVKYASNMITPEAMQLIELNKAAVLDVARCFGIPPYKLAAAVDGNSMTYQNVGQADMAWVRESLDEYLTAIEDAMTNCLPRGQVAQFDTENWLRAAAVIATVPAVQGGGTNV